MKVEKTPQINISPDVAEKLKKENITLCLSPFPGERDATRLQKFGSQIEHVGLMTLHRIVTQMPLHNVAVKVYDRPNHVIPELGIAGYTHFARPVTEIEIRLDPSSPVRESAIGSDLERTIRHEAHHAVRFDHQGKDQTLYERLATEGLAQHFETEGTETLPAIYAKALSPEEIQSLLPRATEVFESGDRDIWNAWFFGSDELDIPRWAGYSLGYSLIDAYLQAHPDKKPSTLFTTPASKLIMI